MKGFELLFAVPGLRRGIYYFANYLCWHMYDTYCCTSIKRPDTVEATITFWSKVGEPQSIAFQVWNSSWLLSYHQLWMLCSLVMYRIDLFASFSLKFITVKRLITIRKSC